MNPKFIMYIISTILVFLALDSININNIFKKSKPFQARLFYFIIAFALVYLLTNFVYDFITATKII